MLGFLLIVVYVSQATDEAMLHAPEIEAYRGSLHERRHIQSACPVCLNGSLPDPEGAHRCVICKIPVHAIEPCSTSVGNDEGYGEARMCFHCSSTTSTTKETLLEINEIENWRGEVRLPIKKRKRKSYLEPNSEWSSINLSDGRKVIPIGLLKNGHRPELKPLKINGEIYVLANTCAFDAILQLLCTASCDSVEYKSFLCIHKVPIFELARAIIMKGVNMGTYSMRCKILSSVFTSSILPNGVKKIDVASTLPTMLERVWIENPTLVETVVCSGVQCPNPKRDIASVSILVKFDHEISREKFEQSVARKLATRRCSFCPLSIDPKSDRRLLRQPNLSKTCRGTVSRKIALSPHHLLIEPTTEEIVETDGQGDVIVEVVVALGDIPARLDVHGEQYFLRGAVSFTGKANPGHYVAYCRRHNDQWQCFDDLQLKGLPCSAQKKITCHLLFYSI